MSIAEVPFSQLIQHSRETVAKLEGSHGRRLRLVRRDGEDLFLESARRAEADMETLAMATRLFSELMSTEETSGMFIRGLAGVFPWMRFLPPGEARAFADEFTETARACAEVGSMAALQPVIEAWRATAEVHSDPDLLRRLTAPADGTDYGPVPTPEATG
jgi:hypothetical protein